jgi:hypothetical protein
MGQLTRFVSFSFSKHPYKVGTVAFFLGGEKEIKELAEVL